MCFCCCWVFVRAVFFQTVVEIKSELLQTDSCVCRSDWLRWSFESVRFWINHASQRLIRLIRLAYHPIKAVRHKKHKLEGKKSFACSVLNEAVDYHLISVPWISWYGSRCIYSLWLRYRFSRSEVILLVMTWPENDKNTVLERNTCVFCSVSYFLKNWNGSMPLWRITAKRCSKYHLRHDANIVRGCAIKLRPGAPTNTK